MRSLDINLTARGRLHAPPTAAEVVTPKESKRRGEGLEIKVSQYQARVPVTVFYVTGDIDASTSKQLESQVKQALQSGARFLLFDLSRVTYISMYGIRSISRIYNWLRDGSENEHVSFNGRRDRKFKTQNLKLANPAPHIRYMLTSTGIDMFIEIHNDLKKALDSF